MCVRVSACVYTYANDWMSNPCIIIIFINTWRKTAGKRKQPNKKREPLKTTAAAKSERATNAAKQARQLFINLKR